MNNENQNDSENIENGNNEAKIYDNLEIDAFHVNVVQILENFYVYLFCVIF